MGITWKESQKLRRVEPMTQQEVLRYYETNGEQLPDRFSDCEKAKQNEIISHYKPFRYSQER